jgi:hypothetical protein
MQHNQLSVSEHAKFHYRKFRGRHRVELNAVKKKWQDGDVAPRLAELGKSA